MSKDYSLGTTGLNKFNFGDKVLLKIFFMLSVLKCLSIRYKNFFPMLVLTDWQYGGLKNIIFLVRFRFFLSTGLVLFSYLSLCLKIDWRRAS